ncbi:MAG: TetR/AcrR family transcriptional regulator [Ruminiclostridium sp.]|nr:TetR/AcrR family transcriptional regulator [Ruminiclostridium sp.]
MAKRPHITETTRKNLMDAFWKLYLTKPVERISVREITDIAGYNRGTFYLYFKDVHDVLEQIEDDILKIIEEKTAYYSGIFFKDFSRNDLAEVTAAAMEIFECCDYRPLILLSDKGDPHFEEEIKKRMYVHLEEGVDNLIAVDNITKEYTIQFVISGVIGIIKKWYADGMVIPAEEHLSTVCNVIFGSRIMFKKKVN